MEINMEWLNEAIRAIKDGICNKLRLDNITVYRVGNVIRIDIKEG